MRKSTIFISAVLTTFALAMLYGVVSAYQNMPKPTAAVTQAIDTATPEPTIEPTTTATVITPQQAAQLASQVMNNNHLLSAESSNINGTAAYKITFTNNDVVYVGLDGQVLGVQVAPVVVNASVPAPAPAPAVTAKHRNRNNDNNIAGSGGESHDAHDD